jgi:acetylornithine deacetylase/succinyl-diaminopimelate desuccinylase-like protein
MTSFPSNVVELCQTLIRIPSVNPDGDPGTDATGEATCAEYVGNFLRQCGADISYDEIQDGRPNVIGRFPSNSDLNGIRKPRILFAPHTDTVSVSGMTIPPFGGELREGCIWGRGASDTKGPMAAMLWALYTLADRIPSLGVEVHFVGFMSEESAQLGSRHFAHKYPPYDLAIVGEPTNLQTVFRHKGCMWADIHTHGVAAHGATPERGINAIVKMAKLIQALDTDFRLYLKELSGVDEWLGTSTINFGMVRGGSRTNIVADHCTLRVDMRTTPSLIKTHGAEKALRDFVLKIDPEATVEVLPETSPLDTDRDHFLVRKLVECGAPLSGAPWFCDAAFLSASGTPAVAIGPGSIAQAHTKDEYIRVEDLDAGVEFFRNYLLSLEFPK